MNNPKSLSIIFVIGLVTASAMAALVADKMHVVTTCKDVRVAMDGAIDAVVESGGLNRQRTAVTLFKSHNRKKIKIQTVEVNMQQAKSGMYYMGENLRLSVGKNVNSKTGRQPAYLQGEVEGEKLNIAMGCTL